jgi:peptidoglycan/LPS O-acetylase OafA/YrhL
MTTHVKAVAVLFLILGVFGLLAAIGVAMAFGLAGGIVGANAEPHDAAIALPIIGLTGTMLVIYLVATSLPGVIAAIGLLKLRPWARVLGIVAAVLYLIHIPFGTAVGAYSIWVLVNRDTERLLGEEPATAV